jgi:hypothetical protein
VDNIPIPSKSDLQARSIEPVSSQPRVWHGPDPAPLHRLLLDACLAPEKAAQTAWEEWLRRCRFDQEDPASYELAAMAVARLGLLAGNGSEVSRCQGWKRRSWFLSEIAIAAAERLRQTALQLGLEPTPVGDLSTYNAGLEYAGKHLPIRSIEVYFPGAATSDLRRLYASAMEGPANGVIRSHRLPLILRSRSRFPEMSTPAGRIVWLASRNWCRFPPGRLRWILEVRANAQSAPDPLLLAAHIEDQARQLGTLAAVVEALRLTADSGPDDGLLAPVLARLTARPVPMTSRVRLWAARHQAGLGLQALLCRRLHPP